MLLQRHPKNIPVEAGGALQIRHPRGDMVDVDSLERRGPRGNPSAGRERRDGGNKLTTAQFAVGEIIYQVFDDSLDGALANLEAGIEARAVWAPGSVPVYTRLQPGNRTPASGRSNRNPGVGHFGVQLPSGDGGDGEGMGVCTHWVNPASHTATPCPQLAAHTPKSVTDGSRSRPCDGIMRRSTIPVPQEQ